MTEPTEIVRAILEQVRIDKLSHPDPKPLWNAAQEICDRAETCRSAAGSTADPDHPNRTARAAIAMTALVVRMIQDHALPLPEAPENGN